MKNICRLCLIMYKIVVANGKLRLMLKNPETEFVFRIYNCTFDI